MGPAVLRVRPELEICVAQKLRELNYTQVTLTETGTAMDPLVEGTSGKRIPKNPIRSLATECVVSFQLMECHP